MTFSYVIGYVICICLRLWWWYNRTNMDC